MITLTGSISLIADAIWPISSSPSSVSPSKMPLRVAFSPSISSSCGTSAPLSSASAMRLYSLFLTSLEGASFFRQSIVSPSCSVVHTCLKASLALLSFDRANSVPICTPSAPSTCAARQACPDAMPPAAMSGSDVA